MSAMKAEPDMRAEWGELFGSLASAFAAGNRDNFVEILDRIAEARGQSLYQEVREASGRLRDALDQFQLNSRLATLAGKDVPDARVRLDHALKLAEDGAHRTLDLVERSCPLANNVAREAAELVSTVGALRKRVTLAVLADALPRIHDFLAVAQRDSEAVRANLTDVLMAQSSQDLSGQIIRGVITLVGEVESTLGQLALLAGHDPADVNKADQPTSSSQGFGPAVPGLTNGAVSEQNDVDALLADLGM
jgi:chemotaxis protein CheZ